MWRQDHNQPEADELARAKESQRRPVINALLRGQALLQCNLQPADQDDAVSLVLWYKDNSMVPIYR